MFNKCYKCNKEDSTTTAQKPPKVCNGNAKEEDDKKG